MSPATLYRVTLAAGDSEALNPNIKEALPLFSRAPNPLKSPENRRQKPARITKSQHRSIENRD